jgi:hypothetical protein
VDDHTHHRPYERSTAVTRQEALTQAQDHLSAAEAHLRLLEGSWSRASEMTSTTAMVDTHTLLSQTYITLAAELRSGKVTD